LGLSDVHQYVGHIMYCFPNNLRLILHADRVGAQAAELTSSFVRCPKGNRIEVRLFVILKVIPSSAMKRYL
jgi:hypothetical protein